MKYFYIITFDNQIFEIKYSQEKYEASVKAWKDKSILLFQEIGGISGSTIAKVLLEDNYESYVFSAKPKLFIKDGTWYDGIERKIVRREKWKQDEIDNRLRITAKEEKELTSEETKKMLEKYKPEFLEEVNSIAEKMRIK